MFSKFMQGKLIPDFWVCSKENLLREGLIRKKQAKRLKSRKRRLEVDKLNGQGAQWLIGLMVHRRYGRQAQWLIGSMVDRLDG